MLSKSRDCEMPQKVPPHSRAVTCDQHVAKLHQTNSPSSVASSQQRWSSRRLVLTSGAYQPTPMKIPRRSISRTVALGVVLLRPGLCVDDAAQRETTTAILRQLNRARIAPHGASGADLRCQARRKCSRSRWRSGQRLKSSRLPHRGHQHGATQIVPMGSGEGE